MRALYPNVEIFCNPYGQSALELRLLLDAGNLPGVTASQDVVSIWFLWASALALGLGYLLAAWVVTAILSQLFKEGIEGVANYASGLWRNGNDTLDSPSRREGRY